MNSRFTYTLLLLTAIVIASCGDVHTVDPVHQQTDAESDASWFERGRPDYTAIPGHYIVLLEDNLSAAEARNIADELAGMNGGRVGHYLRSLRKGFTMKCSPKSIARLRKDRRVKRVIEDHRTKVVPKRERRKGRTNRNRDTVKTDPGGTDTLTTEPPDTDPGGGTTPGTQEIPWGVTYVGGARDATGHTCWILDTGIDLDNEDLNVDVGRSRNFVADGSTSADDLNGHGTHIAGTIAAKDNTFGVVGVAANATVISIRVLDATANGSYSWLLAGLDYVIANAESGDVVNMSLAGPPSDIVDDAVRRLADRGVKVVVAAGNYAADAGLYTPGRVRHTNVFTVSAIDESGCLGWFSNWGNPPISFAAPGMHVVSLALNGGVVTHTGTSMAAPHVAGLLLSGGIHATNHVCGDPDGTPDLIAHR